MVSENTEGTSASRSLSFQALRVEKGPGDARWAGREPGHSQDIFFSRAERPYGSGYPGEAQDWNRGRVGKGAASPTGTDTAEAPLQAHEEDGERRKGDSRTL